MASCLVRLKYSRNPPPSSELPPAEICETQTTPERNDPVHHSVLPLRSPVRRTQSEITLGSTTSTRMPVSIRPPAHIEHSIEIDHLHDEPFLNATDIPAVLRSPVQPVAPSQPRPLIALESGEHFTPSLNMTKARSHNTGFNPIRLNSVQPISHKYKSSTNSRLRDLIDDASIKGESALSVAVSTSEDNNAELKRSRSMSLGNIPDHTGVPGFKKRRVHDRSTGPSMTPSAIDYRERKKTAAEFQERFAELLDNDIIQQVEEEGWLTPIGRLFKAGVRQLERVAQERRMKPQEITSLNQSAPSDRDSLPLESVLLRIENDQLKTKLDRMKQSLRDLVEE